MAAVAAISVIGSLLGGVSSSIAANANAKTARLAGEIESESINRAANRVIGSQKAAFGASGVTTASGSALDVLADSVAEGQLSVLRSRFSRETEAESFEASGRRSLTSSVFDAGTTVLGSVSASRATT